ncbi:32437_t:CDS:2, partial [Gigaspora margarita]
MFLQWCLNLFSSKFYIKAVKAVKVVKYILDLLIASDELLLSELFEYIQDYLLSTKSDWVKRNVVKVHRTIYPYDGSNWTNEDFMELERILHNCIPLIRFFQISSSDFYDKVWPFNKILPENLKEDIIRYHFKRNAVINSSNGFSSQSLIPKYALPPRIIPFDSTLIKAEHVAKLCDWIDRKDGKPYTFEEIPYKFKLLIRGSRDGFEAETFHEKCDNKGATIVVMQIAYSGELVGGYNPIEWTTGDVRLTTQNSFLFSFPKQGNLNDAKLSRVTRAGYAIRIKDKTHGPCFGDKDLWMKNNFNAYDSCSSDKDDYSDRVTTLSKFWVLEYEVFQ